MPDVKMGFLPREQQLNNMIARCYDDYCYYNQMDMDEREQFVREHVVAATASDMIIPYMALYLTTSCTLNCEKCNNLMPMFKGQNVVFDTDKTLSSLRRILDTVQEMIFCELVGGEPFLCPDFERVLDEVASYDKVRQIVVVTNGTVIPKESIVEKLARFHVIVRVSDYGLFEQMAKFISVMDKAGVNARVMQNMKWLDPGGVEFRGRSAGELREQYNRCDFSLKCKYLCEDRLFTCARIASLYYLGIAKAPGDMLVIDEELSSEKLYQFYLRDVAAGCQFCDLWTEDSKEIAAAEQVNRDLERSNYTIISNYELEHYKSESRKYRDMIGEER